MKNQIQHLKRTILFSGIMVLCLVQEINAFSIQNIVVSDLKGEQIANNIKLNWKYFNAVSGVQLFLEKSEDGIVWETMALCESGQTEHRDENPIDGMHYYRLKQIESNTNVFYTNIISVEYKGANKLKWFLFPNPAKEIIFLDLNKSGVESVQLKLYNHNFKLIENIDPGFQALIPIDVSSKPKGLYFIEIIYDNTTEKLRFIKE